MVSNWQGIHLSGSVPDETTRDYLVGIVTKTFGVSEKAVSLGTDSRVSGVDSLGRLGKLVSSLGEVRNLRLESTGDGYVMWGRVDHPETLGRILHTRNSLGLELVVENRIDVSSAPREATITLFSDGNRAVLSGNLPRVSG